MLLALMQWRLCLLSALGSALYLSTRGLCGTPSRVRLRFILLSTDRREAPGMYGVFSEALCGVPAQLQALFVSSECSWPSGLIRHRSGGDDGLRVLGCRYLEGVCQGSSSISAPTPVDVPFLFDWSRSYRNRSVDDQVACGAKYV